MRNLFNLLSAMCGKIKKADLSQNDPEAADYVKNRTHWVERSEIFVVDEQTQTFGKDPITVSEKAFVAGEKYTVIIDGESYEKEAVGITTPFPGIAVGLLPFMGGSDSFSFISAAGTGIAAILAKTGTHTVSVKGIGEVFHTIPYSYLPYATNVNPGMVTVNKTTDEKVMNVVRQTESHMLVISPFSKVIIQSNESSKLFELTVDDSGNLTATEVTA